MRVPRFFIPPGAVQNGQVRLVGPEAAHAVRVLRLEPGSRVGLLDGSGTEYLAVVVAVDEGTLTAAVDASRERASEVPFRLTLVQGLPKSDKMELIVQKATELGVSRIVPTLTKRCVSRPEPAKGAAKVTRWQRIAQEAAKQAGRAVVPEVAPLTELCRCVDNQSAGELVLIAWEEAATGGLATLLAAKAPAAGVTLIIGPEGGLTPEEVDELTTAGGHVITLGPRILRTETAGLAALAAILFATGNLGS